MLVIDGLKAAPLAPQKGGGAVTEFTCEGGPALKVRLTEFPDLSARAELLGRDGERPGVDDGENVAIVGPDDGVFERVVRAMASLHLGASEAEGGYTAADRMMVGAGFGIGRTSSGSPVWINVDGQNGWTMIVDRDEGKGLPVHPGQPARAILVGPGGRMVTLQADDLEGALVGFGSGALRRMFNPRSDVTVTATSTQGRTVH